MRGLIDLLQIFLIRRVALLHMRTSVNKQQLQFIFSDNP